MRLLLDTHALFWVLLEPGKLPATLRATLEDPANLVFASDPAVRQYQVTVLWGAELQAPRAAYRAKRRPRRR